jgi:hypothetical protein
MARSRQLVRLVHWKDEEVPERAAKLEAVGYAVDGEVPGTTIGVKGEGAARDPDRLRRRA